MKQAVSKALHMFRVYCVIAKMSIISRMNNRMSVVLSSSAVFIEMLVYVVFANAIFNNIPAVQGLSSDQLFIIFGSGMIIDALGWLTFRAGGGSVGEAVRSGKLDADLVKPLPSAFLVMFRRIDIEDVARIVAGLMLIIPHASAIAEPFALHFVLYIISLFFGLIAYFAFILLISTTSFYLGKNESMYFLLEQGMEISRYPHTVFAKPIRVLVLSFIPLALFASVPTYILTTQNPWGWLGFIIVWPCILLWLVIHFWNYSLKRYDSASG